MCNDVCNLYAADIEEWINNKGNFFNKSSQFGQKYSFLTFSKSIIFGSFLTTWSIGSIKAVQIYGRKLHIRYR